MQLPGCVFIVACVLVRANAVRCKSEPVIKDLSCLYVDLILCFLEDLAGTFLPEYQVYYKA